MFKEVVSDDIFVSNSKRILRGTCPFELPRLIGIVRENVDTEVKEFADGYFPRGDLFLDEKKQVLNALNNPKIGLWALLKLIAPVNALKSEGITGNLIGEGDQPGGIMVIAANGQILLSQKEVSESLNMFIV